jgi:nitroimidazol reductase NimA-like FMN-containing flavoprotein (pyridoxamine 5'-phosphate oxidase superfamily)
MTGTDSQSNDPEQSHIRDSATPRTQLRRAPERGSYELATVHRLIDEIGVGSIAYSIDSQPRLIPTLLWREGDGIYWHGSTASKALKDLAKGIDCCLNVYATDGLVLARSGMHSSVNYRSATAYGTAVAITDEDHKLAAMQAFVDRYLPGRWPDLRPPHANELKASMVMRMEISESSAKIRTGPPSDDEEDYSLPIWAGVVPISTVVGTPQDDPRLAPGIPRPDYLTDIRIG